MPLDGRGELPLAVGGRLFVELAGAQFGEKPRFFHGPLEAAQRHLEGLVFLDAHGRHADSFPDAKARILTENSLLESFCLALWASGHANRSKSRQIMLVLGIETSCDETGVAVYDSDRGLLAHALHSQVALHDPYGGVVPELASRDHVRRLLPLARQVLRGAGVQESDLDAIAFTQGPGLAGALLVGAAVANGLAFGLGIRAVGVHHLEGHLLSPLLEKNPPSFPFVALLISGGHTQLMRVSGVGQYEMLGETLDDAAGEAFDKTAKLLGLGYPGGPALAKLAERGRADRFAFPRPMLEQLETRGDLNFSFSGLKTAV